MEPSQANPEPRVVESVAASAEEDGPVLGYAARPAGARRLWRWIRPGSVLFFVLIAGLAAGAGWGAWNWRLAADRKALEACATTGSGPLGTRVSFTHAPSRGALRHLSRLPGSVRLFMEWPESENAPAAQAFGAADLGNVSEIWMRKEINADLLLKQLAHPDRGLKALTELNLYGTKVTDAGLKELSRPDSGLKALTRLSLGETNVTDAGLKEMSRSDSGLRALTVLGLSSTKITDAGLKELARPDSGLKALTELGLADPTVTDAGLKELTRPDSGLKALTRLHLRGTKVTDAGIKELQAARPGLTVVR